MDTWVDNLAQLPFRRLYQEMPSLKAQYFKRATLRLYLLSWNLLAVKKTAFKLDHWYPGYKRENFGDHLCAWTMGLLRGTSSGHEIEMPGMWP